MAFIEHDDRPGLLRASVASEFVIPGPHRSLGAGRWRSEERLGPLVVDEFDGLLRETAERDSPPPLRHAALRADDQDFVLRHGGNRRPNGQCLAESSKVPQQEPRPAFLPSAKDCCSRGNLMRARNEG